MNFTPPEPKAVPAWATYVPYRRVRFKTHTGIGHAKNAVGQRHWNGGVLGGIVYHLEDGKYVEYARVESGASKAEHPLWANTEGKKALKAAQAKATYAIWNHNRLHAEKKTKFCPECGGGLDG